MELINSIIGSVISNLQYKYGLKLFDFLICTDRAEISGPLFLWPPVVI